ncbi:hypothetical protein J7E62_32940 [Variovorax paradoxus]|nr:hypothetical protein [Variovorax paradoxus]
MNTQAFPGHAPSAAASPDWSMEMGVDGFGEGVAYFADVKRNGQEMCRITLAGGVSNDIEARKALKAKARIWIDEFQRREGPAAAADQPLVLREP